MVTHLFSMVSLVQELSYDWLIKCQPIIDQDAHRFIGIQDVDCVLIEGRSRLSINT